MLPGTTGLLLKSGGGNDAFTMLLLHMDGTDGGSTFIDSSPKGKTVSINGGSGYQTLAAAKKFGTAGARSNSATAALVVANTSGGDPDLAMGSGDWTIDWWMNRTSGLGMIFDGRGTGNGDFPTINLSGAGVLNYITGAAGTTRITSTTTLAAGTYYHAAIVKYSGTTKMYINGTKEGADFTDAITYLTANNRPLIGNNFSANNRFVGDLDEFRISKGIARWTANFTPPSGPYTA